MCEHNQISVIYEEKNRDHMSLVLNSHTCIHIKMNITEEQDLPKDFDHIKTKNESSIDVFYNSKKSDDFEFEILMCLILQHLNIENYKIEIFTFENISSSCILSMFTYALKEMKDYNVNLINDDGMKIEINEKIIYSCSSI